MRLKWKVGEAPTGRYRSFAHRSWPMAYDMDNPDKVIAYIVCEDSYVPRDAEDGRHAPLTIRVACYSDREVGFDWKALKGQSATLKEAKERAWRFAQANPSFFINKEPGV